MIIYNENAKELSTQFPNKICVDNENVYVNGSHYTFKNPPCKALKFSAELKLGIKITRRYSDFPPDIEYSFEGRDRGAWKKLGTDYVEFGEGVDIYVRGNNPEGLNGSTFGFKNSAVGVECSGNVMHLLSYKEDLTEIPESDNCFTLLFMSSPIITAPKLPATTLYRSCYSNMFLGCSKLTAAPELPATTLDNSCYYRMFYNCSKLTIIPEVLPATTLANNCYYLMFYGCTSMTTTPKLPATTLVKECYRNMFERCTSLTTAPELPATTLVSYCYEGMFNGCTSLTTAPELPATTLANGCYYEMFYGCSQLNNIKVKATSWNTNYTTRWVTGVKSTGTFTKPSGTSISSGSNGIPSKWTVVNI